MVSKYRKMTNKYHQENPDARKHSIDPDKVAAKHAARRARENGHHDPTTDHDKVAKIYKLAHILRRDLKQDYQVDHIQPVSKGGSSHERNLQVITAKQNYAKGDDHTNKVKGITINDIELLHPDIFNAILNGETDVAPKKSKTYVETPSPPQTIRPVDKRTLKTKRMDNLIKEHKLNIKWGLTFEAKKKAATPRTKK